MAGGILCGSVGKAPPMGRVGAGAAACGLDSALECKNLVGLNITVLCNSLYSCSVDRVEVS